MRGSDMEDVKTGITPRGERLKGEHFKGDLVEVAPQGGVMESGVSGVVSKQQRVLGQRLPRQHAKQSIFGCGVERGVPGGVAGHELLSGETCGFFRRQATGAESGVKFIDSHTGCLDNIGWREGDANQILGDDKGFPFANRPLQNTIRSYES